MEWDAYRNDASQAITFKFANKYQTVQPGEVVMIPHELAYIVDKRGLPFVKIEFTFAYGVSSVPIEEPKQTTRNNRRTKTKR